MLGELGDEKELKEFLIAVLRRTGRNEISSIEIKGDTKLTADIIGDKTSILDILAILDDGTHLNIELQIKRVVGLDRRLLQYWSREYARSLSAGEYYDVIPGVITVIITEFDMVNLPDFHTSFHLREDQNPDYVLTDAMEFHIISIPKFRTWQQVDLKGDSLHRWLTFFDQKASTATIEEVIRMDEAIQKANERMEFVMQDKESLRLYHMREMAMSDWSSGIKLARSEGREEGIMDTARKLYKLGVSYEIISLSTGMDETKLRGIWQ
jgi:predicted transposase/invertase (TIGR01784 family)